MNTPQLCAMSLIAFLVGCFSTGKEPAGAPAAAYPRFPETDVTGRKFERVGLDSGYTLKTFFISRDKLHVYGLGYKHFGLREPDDPRKPERTDAALFELDVKGGVTRRLVFSNTDDSWGSSMGMIGDELLLLTGDEFVVINTTTFTAAEKIPVWHEQHFPTRQNIELMTPDEYQAAYTALFDAAMTACTGCHWLEWPGGKYFVYVPGSLGKRAAWSPLTYQDDVIEPLRKRFSPIEVWVNPTVSIDSGGDNLTVVDNVSRLHEEDILEGGTELDYPNYKHRAIVQYALTIGPRVMHFSTTDQKRHDLRLGLADNKYLTTADGAVWVRYMSVLYRIE